MASSKKKHSAKTPAKKSLKTPGKKTGKSVIKIGLGQPPSTKKGKSATSRDSTSDHDIDPPKPKR